MGSPESERNRRSTNEGPQHSVKISQPFYMGVFEVTQAEYESVMGTNPSWFSETGGGKHHVRGMTVGNFPVERVLWFDAIEFCNKLSANDGLTPYYSITNETRNIGSIRSANVSPTSGNGYRLPTEAEWEYAARANTTTPFYFGNTLSNDDANVDGTTTKGKRPQRTAAVGSYTKNAFGLFDMHGNVQEWCFDLYDKDVYSKRFGTTVDPRVTWGSESRVFRGGSWLDFDSYARSAFRGWCEPTNQVDHGGFRVILPSVAVRTP